MHLYTCAPHLSSVFSPNFSAVLHFYINARWPLQRPIIISYLGFSWLCSGPRWYDWPSVELIICPRVINKHSFIRRYIEGEKNGPHLADSMSWLIFWHVNCCIFLFKFHLKVFPIVQWNNESYRGKITGNEWELISWRWHLRHMCWGRNGFSCKKWY